MTKFLNNADIKGYIAQTAVTSYLLKADSTGRLVAAIAGTDYQAPTTALLPAGGTAGQILAKIDGTNYNTQWIDNYTPQVKHDVKLGAALSKGTPVYVSSANGTNMIVSAASNASEATSSKTLGLLETGGILNDTVKVITEGLLAGLNTSTATAGDPVWLGPNGTLLFGLANKPSAPAHMVSIGIVTRVQSVNGEIFVKVQNGFELDELHNVALASSANNEGLFYDSATSLWKNKTIAAVLGYTPANGANYLPLTGGTLTGDLTLSGTNPRLYFTDTDNNPDYFISNTDGTFTVYDVTNSVGRFKIYSGGNAEFTNSLTVANLYLGSLTNEQIMISGTGSRGIGISTITSGDPYVRLYDNTTIKADIWWGRSGNYMGINSLGAGSLTAINPFGGYVGIGTTSPTERLHVYSSATSGEIRLGGGNGSGNARMYFQAHATNAYIDMYGNNSYLPLQINASPVSFMGGSVGIGTSSPAKTLHVYTSGNEGIYLQGTGGGVWMNIQSAAGNLWSIGAQNDGMGVYNRTSSLYAFFIKDNRQLQLQGYTASSSYSGTAAGYLAFDSSGNVITVAGVAATDDTKLPLAGGQMTGQFKSSSTAPIQFNGNSNTGTYNNTTIYANQNNTSGDTANGIFIERGRLTDSASAEVRQFVIGARGGQIQWRLDGSGNSVQTGNATAAIVYANTHLVTPLIYSGGGSTSFGNSVTFTSVYSGSGSDYTGISNPAYKVDVASGYWRVVYKGAHSTVSGVYNYETGKNVYWGEPTDTGGYYFRGRTLYITESNGTDRIVIHAGNIGSQSVTYATNSTRLYASDSPYTYGGAAPYYLYMNYDGGSYWELKVSPATPGTVRVAYANSAGSASSASTSSQVTINYNNDSNSTYQLLWGSGNSVYGTSQVYVNPSSDVIYARGGYISPSNPWGTSDSAYFPNGITTAGGQNWIYGATFIGNAPSNGSGVLINSNGSSYFRSNVGTNSHGSSARFHEIQSAAGNFIPYSFESEYGNHSWGTVLRIRINQVGADRPSMQFSYAGTDNRWNVGYCYPDDNFRITQNMAYRNDNSTSDGWGTERFRINTDGNTYAAIGGTLYANGNLVWHASNAPRAGNSNLMYYAGFTLDANTMPSNSTGFTYAVNAPYTGPIAKFSEDGYPLQLNATYSGGTSIAYRTRNGDAGSWNSWYAFITSANIGSQTVANTTSISSAVGGSYNWTGVNYFKSNLGGYCGSLSNPSLQANSDSNNSAFLSFHKGGHYAVNMGLDADNVLRIGGWSAAANRWQLDMSGNQTVAGSMYASYFYGSGSIRCGDMWGGAGLYRPSGDMVFGTEAANWVFSSQANTRAYFASGDGNLWMQWSGEFLSTTLGRKHQDGANPSYGAVYADNWFRAYGDCGLYSQSYGGHIRRALTGSFGNWETFGYNRNGWGGFVFLNNYNLNLMMNSSGDSGFYQENGNGWVLFYNRGNHCWGIGTDNTWSGDGLRCVKQVSAEYGYTTWSDRRAKENITSITNALDKVLAMNGVYFNYIKDETKTKRVGFIAQELQTVLPEAVNYAEEIDEYNVNYGQIVSVLTEAIKEQNIEIQSLKAQLQTLLN